MKTTKKSKDLQGKCIKFTLTWKYDYFVPSKCPFLVYILAGYVKTVNQKNLVMLPKVALPVMYLSFLRMRPAAILLLEGAATIPRLLGMGWSG